VIENSVYKCMVKTKSVLFMYVRKTIDLFLGDMDMSMYKNAFTHKHIKVVHQCLSVWDGDHSAVEYSL